MSTLARLPQVCKIVSQVGMPRKHTWHSYNQSSKQVNIICNRHESICSLLIWPTQVLQRKWRQLIKSFFLMIPFNQFSRTQSEPSCTTNGFEQEMANWRQKLTPLAFAFSSNQYLSITQSRNAKEQNPLFAKSVIMPCGSADYGLLLGDLCTYHQDVLYKRPLEAQDGSTWGTNQMNKGLGCHSDWQAASSAISDIRCLCQRTSTWIIVFTHNSHGP